MREDWTELSRVARGGAFGLIGDQAMKKWRIAGINFDHMHMGDNLRMAYEHPNVESVGICDEQPIGDVIEVHYYDGNRGPLWHVADKKTTDAETVAREKPNSWFYKKSAGGGSLLDYLGYGTTLGTWYMHGRSPIEVTTIVDQ